MFIGYSSTKCFSQLEIQPEMGKKGSFCFCMLTVYFSSNFDDFPLYIPYENLLALNCLSDIRGENGAQNFWFLFKSDFDRFFFYFVWNFLSAFLNRFYLALMVSVVKGVKRNQKRTTPKMIQSYSPWILKHSWPDLPVILTQVNSHHSQRSLQVYPIISVSRYLPVSFHSRLKIHL